MKLRTPAYIDDKIRRLSYRAFEAVNRVTGLSLPQQRDAYHLATGPIALSQYITQPTLTHAVLATMWGINSAIYGITLLTKNSFPIEPKESKLINIGYATGVAGIGVGLAQFVLPSDHMGFLHALQDTALFTAVTAAWSTQRPPKKILNPQRNELEALVD